MNPDIADYVSNAFHPISYAGEHNTSLAVVVGGEMGQIVQNHTGIVCGLMCGSIAPNQSAALQCTVVVLGRLVSTQ